MTFEQMVKENEGLLLRFARRYSNYSKISEDDLIQEGMLGIFKASQTFDASKGSFSTHAGWCIRSKMSAFVRKMSRTIRLPSNLFGSQEHFDSISFDVPIEDDFNILDCLCENKDFTDEILDKNFVKRILMKLKKRERDIVIKKYYFNYTYDEIGKIYRLSGERVRQIEHRAIKELKRICASQMLVK